MSKPSDLMQGTLDMLVLKILALEPMNGFAVTPRLAILGIVAGTAAALILSRLMTDLLYGVGPADPVTFGLVTFVMAATSIVACYIPARRAMRVDPMVALRYE